jgi:hypothetical protein
MTPGNAKALSEAIARLPRSLGVKSHGLKGCGQAVDPTGCKATVCRTLYTLTVTKLNAINSLCHHIARLETYAIKKSTAVLPLLLAACVWTTPDTCMLPFCLAQQAVSQVSVTCLALRKQNSSHARLRSGTTRIIIPIDVSIMI